MNEYRNGSVAVVVVNWNRRDLLRRCLQSLERQSIHELFDVVVVDNGSADQSAGMARREFEGNSKFRINVIENAKNRGFCAANNQGFGASKTDFVALLNNDAEADEHWLENLLRAFDGPASVGMAASKILVYEDPRRIDKVGHLMFPDGQNRGRGSGELDDGQYDQIEEVLWPDGCAAMYRRAMLDEIGGFDEEFFAYADDAELGLRARIAGWGCLYIPDAVVRHHRGSTLGLRSTRRLELIERNRVLLAVKLFPWSLLCLNVPYWLARTAAGLWAALRNRGEVARYPGIRGKLRVLFALLKGNLQALRMIPGMLRKRRDLSSIRKLTPREVKHLLRRHRISLSELSEQAI